MAVKKSGELQYTARAYRQDSQDAMKGDVIRALVELITNADDAYDAKGGVIKVSLLKSESPFQASVSVHDAATGLNGEGLENCFARMGDVNEKFVEDKGTRGLFGRGAKDVAALGKVKFMSVKNGLFSSLEIDPLSARFSMEEIDESITTEYLALCQLDSGQSGLTAELFIHDSHKIPAPKDMIYKLQNHIQLRDLINRNTVFYFDYRSNSEVLLKGSVPSGTLVLDCSLDVPGYEQKIGLKVFQLEEKQNGAIDEYSRHGLLISGKGAAYENTFLHLSKRPETGWFAGRIEAPQIHDLARSTDTNSALDAKNPTRIVSRQRDGLVKNHPYFRALSSAVDLQLKALLDQMAETEGANQRESDHMRKRFDALSQILANTLQEILDENDSEALPKSENIAGESVALTFIPPRRILKIGESASITVRVPKTMNREVLSISLREGHENIHLLETKIDNWKEHERLNCWHGSIKVSGIEAGRSVISAELDGQRFDCELFVVHIDPSVDKEVTAMEFNSKEYRVSPSRARNVEILAPVQMSGEKVKLTYSSDLVSGPEEVELTASNSGRSSKAIVRIIAGKTNGDCELSANVSSESVETLVKVAESANDKSPGIRIEIIGSDNPPRRVDTIPEDSQLVIRIYGKHKSISAVLGPPTDGGFRFDESPAAQATISEIVGQQLSIYAVERDAEKNPDKYQDASSIFYRQQEYLGKFVVALQRGLLEI